MGLVVMMRPEETLIIEHEGEKLELSVLDKTGKQAVLDFQGPLSFKIGRKNKPEGRKRMVDMKEAK